MPDPSDRIALPLRVHEFLLAVAGRIDDDALTDARELLAVAELDRAVDLLVASLVAGRIPITTNEHAELRDLVEAVRGAPSLVTRVIVDDNARPPRHRFTAGAMDDPAPDAGVLEAIGRVVDVLPDIRSLSCVWRTTPAGAPAGPVPQRVVLVETGPAGFAPSTAYRVETALRRAGIRAAVEVLAVGAELTDYHDDGLAIARRLALRASGGRDEAADVGMFTEAPAPRPVVTTRRRGAGAHAEKRPPAQETASGRWRQRVGADRFPTEQRDAPEPPPVVVNERDSTPTRESAQALELAPETPAPAAPVEPARPEHPDHPVVEATTLATAPDPVIDPAAEADLSNRERELLRQLHEELAKREGGDPAAPAQPVPPAPDPNAWQVDRSVPIAGAQPAPEFNPGAFNPNEFGGPSWQSQSNGTPHYTGIDQTAVNGIPPYGSAP